MSRSRNAAEHPDEPERGEPGVFRNLSRIQSRMLYFPADELNRIDVRYDSRWGSDFHFRHLFSRSLTLAQGFSLPDFGELNLSADQLAKYDDLEDFIEAFNDEFSGGTHQFFGLPRYVWQSAPRHYQMIANFGECHDRIMYFIPELDVPKLRASRLRVINECT